MPDWFLGRPLAIGEGSPLCSDLDAARSAGHPDVVAPPTFCVTFTMPLIEARRWSGDLKPAADEVVELGFFDEPPGELHPPTRVVLGLYDAYRASGVFQAW